jgi:hypothetical protein
MLLPAVFICSSFVCSIFPRCCCAHVSCCVVFCVRRVSVFLVSARFGLQFSRSGIICAPALHVSTCFSESSPCQFCCLLVFIVRVTLAACSLSGA